ncbi:MAG: dihydropteroate synthase [Beijerinckiaceae bacterium]
MGIDKYMYALGRGIRGVKQALDDSRAQPDPAQTARDVTPPTTHEPSPEPSPAASAAPVDVAPLQETAVPAREPLVLGARTLVMGIVNVTPDSFSDGGLWFDPAAAIAHGERLAREGADILDIGGESTRPGAAPVTAEDEIARVVPVIRALVRSTRQHLSIDTMKAPVARAAIEAGATVVNDVWGFQFDPDIARVAADAGVLCILMHNRRVDDPGVDMFAEVVGFLSRSLDIALTAGVARERIVVDPGIGFGKTHAQSFEMIRRLPELRAHFGLPVLLGASRKRCIGAASGVEIAANRVAGSVAAHLWGAMHGAGIVRVHDVSAHVQALGVLRAIEQAGRDNA